MAFSLPAVVKATSTSSAKYVLGPDFTLTHIANTSDLTVIYDILGITSADEVVIGSGLITDLPKN